MRLEALFLTTEGREEVRDLLFNFDGRITRANWWLAGLAQINLGFVVMLIFGLFGWLPSLAFCFLLIGYILILNVSIAVGRKRLHDRDKSAWRLLIFYGGPTVLEAVRWWTGRSGGALDFLSLVLFAWAIVELGFLRGVAGPNKYGPDPLAPSSQHAAST